MQDKQGIQQLARIGLYLAGGALFGNGVADDTMYQEFIGGVIAVGSFAWWAIWQRNR